MSITALVEAYFTWIKEVKASDPLLFSKNLEEINYSLNHEKQLCLFLEDGDIWSICFTDLAEHMHETDQSFIKDMLPWSDQFREICRIKTNK